MGSSGGGVGDEPQYVVAKYDYIAQGNQVIDSSKLISRSITIFLRVYILVHIYNITQICRNLTWNEMKDFFSLMIPNIGGASKTPEDRQDTSLLIMFDEKNLPYLIGRIWNHTNLTLDYSFKIIVPTLYVTILLNPF